jgi:hypothetical protein
VQARGVAAAAAAAAQWEEGWIRAGAGPGQDVVLDLWPTA